MDLRGGKPFRHEERADTLQAPISLRSLERRPKVEAQGGSSGEPREGIVRAPVQIRQSQRFNASRLGPSKLASTC
jgi:hypothetical protein